MTPSIYLDLRNCVFEAGYGHEWEWAQTVAAPTNAEDFAIEYIWVVLNSGMKNQIAKLIADRIYPILSRGESARTVFGHPGKAAAIDEVWNNRSYYFARFLLSDDKVAFCRSLPWIGAITCWHLAKNYGVDCAKPDRWLQRVAAETDETVDGLCRRLSDATGDRVATVDLIIWRACNLGLYTPSSKAEEPPA